MSPRKILYLVIKYFICLLSGENVFVLCKVCFPMLATFLRSFLDEIPAYAQSMHVFLHSPQNLRGQTFHPKIIPHK